MILRKRKVDKKRFTFIWLSSGAHVKVHAQLKTARTQESCSVIARMEFRAAKTPENEEGILERITKERTTKSAYKLSPSYSVTLNCIYGGGGTREKQWTVTEGKKKLSII